MTDSLRQVEETLGHRFADPELLRRALTHGSTTAGREGAETYQRLEFLGDRVLGLVVADLLDRRFPKALEGELSQRFNRLVSRGACAEVAREMGLARAVRVSGGEPTANVLGDACESVLGALYRDAGLAAAAAVIGRYWGPRIDAAQGPLRDAKTELQEWAHRRGLSSPAYSEVLRSGPDHAPEFEVEVTVGGIDPGRGTGRTKRDAEQEAAAGVLRREGVWEA
jgi:ribonuclease-3